MRFLTGQWMQIPNIISRWFNVCIGRVYVHQDQWKQTDIRVGCYGGVSSYIPRPREVSTESIGKHKNAIGPRSQHNHLVHSCRYGKLVALLGVETMAKNWLLLLLLLLILPTQGCQYNMTSKHLKEFSSVGSPNYMPMTVYIKRNISARNHAKKPSASRSTSTPQICQLFVGTLQKIKKIASSNTSHQPFQPVSKFLLVHPPTPAVFFPSRLDAWHARLTESLPQTPWSQDDSPSPASEWPAGWTKVDILDINIKRETCGKNREKHVVGEWCFWTKWGIWCLKYVWHSFWKGLKVMIDTYGKKLAMVENVSGRATSYPHMEC